MTGVEKFFDLAFGWIKYFKFWAVMHPYERAIVYRLGNTDREIGPGFHWVIPLGIEEVVEENVVVDTKTVDVRTPTQDGVEIVAELVVGWSIKDIEKFLNDVEDAESAILNLVAPAGRKVLNSRTWETIYKTDPEALDAELTRAARARKPGRFGIHLDWVECSELSRSRTIRLLQG